VIDSSPQRATVYWDVVGGNSAPNPKAYGVAGYTPVRLTVPRGIVKVRIELEGFKPLEQEIRVRRSQKQNFTLERAPRAGKLDLRAGVDGSATGAQVTIDGVARGTLPNTFEVSAGRHQVHVEKAGYLALDEWIELREGELRTRDLSLKPQASGSIMVLGEGEIFIDGQRKDTAPSLITGLAPGAYQVEIRKAGAEPFVKTVSVENGKQVKVGFGVGLGSSSNGGGIRVLADQQDVTIYLDGLQTGTAPVELKDIVPGQHVIEGKRTGFEVAEETVKITPGEQLLVRLKMVPKPEEKGHGILYVKSAEPEAEVFLDGASLGSAPIERKDLEPGRHIVIVRKEGFRDFKREIDLQEFKPVTIVADLKAVATIKFLSNPNGAQVFIDGEPLTQNTPVEKNDVKAGEHQIEFRKSGWITRKSLIKVEGGKDRIVQADLEPSPTGPPPNEVFKRKRGASSLGARALEKGAFIADAGVGYPYILNLGVLVSTLDSRYLKMDVGALVRTYFNVFEFGLQARAEFARAGPFFFGAKAALGGGPGFGGRNTLFAEVQPIIVTLSFADRVNLSLHGKYQYYSDRLCPDRESLNTGRQTLSGNCLDADNGDLRNFGGTNPIESRFDGGRLLAGGSVEIAIDRYLSAWFTIDSLVAPKTGRRAFRRLANRTMFKRDTFNYLAAGLSLKM